MALGRDVAYKCPEPGCEHGVMAATWAEAGECPVHKTDFVPDTSYNDTLRGGFRGANKGWSGGKQILQLAPDHPLRHVESEKQALEHCARVGLDWETGEFKSKALEAKHTAPQTPAMKRAIRDGQLKSGRLSKAEYRYGVKGAAARKAARAAEKKAQKSH